MATQTMQQFVYQVDLSRIVELRHAKGIDEANEFLSKGWVVLWMADMADEYVIGLPSGACYEK